ncbi:3-methyl-2-oxobutanoate hydroxymethyltransferase [Rhodoferax ferrireducens T118]|uniref:3-methyl-2-oxobutanoate hydroxymethyltransferase n=1 Tax=Albidiferax ferrireducens (strain ATCC BAA-621 / DSM 15236 / T118) TaxID=338969 RepID=PANB_ALBFT|nr:3-methyl-2-oxobutanoate hydroxymethyltransferase [Rhodoferax ferrireducens]Q21U09.1 RecName: Full=3-methyl-2-oxobutanoate hydroxymethyltransferase; AltName: Full=Ketopantoate hydroxymethyltransferase; Short=KPHMT [Rhodoferax ferrireducens T118]ABD70744.1 3-methyl-2-oxobutanoate hydroxymethyltransferase [Rhodoferax ferrireducens T118]
MSASAESTNATPYGTLPPTAAASARKPISLPRLLEMHARGEKLTMLTAYDATFAAVADAAGVECILVGDSLGMVCQGLSSTMGVTLQAMCYHIESVARGLRRAQATAWLIGDLPYGSYHESREQALRSAAALMQAGSHMVKLEGGGWTADTVRFLVERGIPVCAHLGLTPQTVHALGGYRVQGKTQESAALMKRQAHELQDAGAALLVLEMVPAALAAELTRELTHCATIGIGAGKDTAGQVLVLHDMLGINLGKMPKFVRNFMTGAPGVKEAMQAYVAAVKNGSFPDNTQHAW